MHVFDPHLVFLSAEHNLEMWLRWMNECTFLQETLALSDFCRIFSYCTCMQALGKLTADSSDQDAVTFSGCERMNVSVCDATGEPGVKAVVVYNSLGQGRDVHVRIPVPNDQVKVHRTRYLFRMRACRCQRDTTQASISIGLLCTCLYMLYSHSCWT